jgi:hypothetical protein
MKPENGSMIPASASPRYASKIGGRDLDTLPIGPAAQEVAGGTGETDRFGHDFLHAWVMHVFFQSDYTRVRYGLNGNPSPALGAPPLTTSQPQ